MPYPAQVNRDRIVERARELIEAQGVDHLSLHRLAEALGVKAPSLYRYFGDKSDLLRAVNEATSRALAAHIRAAAERPPDARARLLAVAAAYRAFAHANPSTYGLLFTNTIPDLRPDAAEQEQMAQVSGESDSLPALRGVWALIHGFVMLELSGQFRRGGDLDAAFVQGIEAYLAGWAR